MQLHPQGDQCQWRSAGNVRPSANPSVRTCHGSWGPRGSRGVLRFSQVVQGRLNILKGSPQGLFVRITLKPEHHKPFFSRGVACGHQACAVAGRCFFPSNHLLLLEQSRWVVCFLLCVSCCVFVGSGVDGVVVTIVVWAQRPQKNELFPRTSQKDGRTPT